MASVQRCGDAFAGTLRDVYVADVRTDQIGKPEQRRECGEVAYDQSKLVLFHHCRGSPTPGQHSAAATVPNRGITAQAPHGHSRGFVGAEPSLGG
jgi:hypothetical protein